MQLAKSSNSSIRQPGALSPLQGIDLQEHTVKGFHRHKHYGWVYGEKTENPVSWLQKNFAKANAAVEAIFKKDLS